MSQALKQVEWCLKKAKKEIETCKKLNKRPKHRGLLEVKTNLEESQNHLKKAEENLRFGLSLDPELYGYKIVESLFYCIYQCFLSIAAKFGYESGNQTCTISLIEYLKEQNKIDLDDKFIEIMQYKDEQRNKNHQSLIDLREDYTYSVKTSVEKEVISEIVAECKEIIEKTKEIVYGKT